MNGGLLMLAGHAIYHGGRWYGGHQNEDRLYEMHVRDAFGICAAESYQALALSGGRSRPQLAPEIGNSEAQGMLEYARAAGLVESGAVLWEGFGRDSFENLFFSMLCFHRQFGEWPSRVGAVSWKFKALRFYLIACGLRLAEGRFRFFGSGDPAGQPAIEAFAAASVQYDATIVRDGEIVDPLHRDRQWFGAVSYTHLDVYKRQRWRRRRENKNAPTKPASAIAMVANAIRQRSFAAAPGLSLIHI